MLNRRHGLRLHFSFQIRRHIHLIHLRGIYKCPDQTVSTVSPHKTAEKAPFSYLRESQKRYPSQKLFACIKFIKKKVVDLSIYLYQRFLAIRFKFLLFSVPSMIFLFGIYSLTRPSESMENCFLTTSRSLPSSSFRLSISFAIKMARAFYNYG